MKKGRKQLLLLGMALCLTACSKGKQETDTKQETMERTEATVPETADGVLVKDIQEEKLNLTDYNLDAKEGDALGFFPWEWMAVSENGYYFWDGNMLMFYDKQSGRVVPLCNRPDCTHTDETCNAVFSAWIVGTDGVTTGDFYGNILYFYEGKLYVVGCAPDGYAFLMEVAADGSSREKIMRLYKADLSPGNGSSAPGEWRDPEICIHRGYVYFIDSRESVKKLRRIKLGGSETEVLYETTGIRPDLYRLEAAGDYVFFQTGNFTDDTYATLEGGIFAYNVQTGDVQMVKKDAISSYTIVGDDIYYAMETGIWKRSLSTQEDVQIRDGINNPDMYADQKFIYWNDWETSKCLYIYDLSGKEICTIKGVDDMIYGSDSQYLLWKASQLNEPSLGVLKLSDVSEKTTKGKIVPY